MAIVVERADSEQLLANNSKNASTMARGQRANLTLKMRVVQSDSSTREVLLVVRN